jgi:hypothetical protein
MAKRIVLAGLLGGLALFLWESVAHMMLPLGDAGIKALANEKAVTAAIKENIKEDGFYLFPAPEDRPGMTSAEKQAAMDKSFEAYRTGPGGMMVVHPNGANLQLPVLLGTQFVTDIAAMLVVAWLLIQARLTGYGARVLFVTITGLIPTLRTGIPFWNWYGFPMTYTVAQAVVHLVGAVLAGLVMAKFVGGAPSLARD